MTTLEFEIYGKILITINCNLTIKKVHLGEQIFSQTSREAHQKEGSLAVKRCFDLIIGQLEPIKSAGVI